MSTFAALYPLPAGEQLLVLLIDDEQDGPVIQYITEINGEKVSATTPVLAAFDTGDHLKRLAAKEEARQAIGMLDEDAVKNIRRKFVADMNTNNKGEKNG